MDRPDDWLTARLRRRTVRQLRGATRPLRHALVSIDRSGRHAAERQRPATDKIVRGVHLAPRW
ncbi:hypothetical protein T261_8405 [Streptomyces lydicus]|nr:hypothetical protein T261_8405 [Streptomyces lydicus]